MKDLKDAVEETKRELQAKGYFNDGFLTGDDEDDNPLSELLGIVDVSNSQGYGAKRDTRTLLQMNMSWVYACVDAIGDEVGQVDFKLLSMKTNGETEEIDDHPILDLIYQPNNFFTKFDLFKLTAVFLELTGEAPWFIVKKNGIPSKVILLDPASLTLVPSKETDQTDMVDHYTYKVYEATGYKEIRLEVDEVVFLRNPDPNNQFRGKGALSAIKSTVELDLTAEQYNKDFFKRSAQPGMVLTTDKPIAQDKLDTLQKKIKDKFEGYKNRYNTLVLSNGLKPEKTGTSHVDMQFNDQQTFSRNKILSAFRVPPTILGITEDVNRANAEASKYVFAERVIKPKLKRITEQLNEFLVPLFGESKVLFIDFEDPVPENKEFILKQSTESYDKGLMTLNEARALLKLDPVDNGDEFKKPAPNPLLNPTGDQSPAQDMTSDNPKEPKKQKLGVYNKTAMRRAKMLMKKQAKKIALDQAVKKEVKHKLESIAYATLSEQMKGKSKTKWKADRKLAIEKQNRNLALFKDKEAKYAFQEKQLNVADQYETKLNGEMVGLFEDQKKIVLDSLDQIKDFGKDDVNKLTLNKDNQVDKFENKLTDLFGALVVDQARLASLLLQKPDAMKSVADFDKNEKVTRYSNIVRSFISRYVISLAKQTTDTTNDKLKEALIEGIDKGESIVEIRNRILGVFESINKNRAEMIARTEVIRATNFATELGYKESGVVEAKEWLAERDERTDDECLSLDGKVEELNSKFTTSDGKLPYPPLHPNCRCTLIPVLK